MTKLGIELRNPNGELCLEERAQGLVSTLQQVFVNPEEGSSCVALARFYTTLSYSQLEAFQKDFLNKNGRVCSPETICLTLLGTAGIESAWNRRKESRAHVAIPMESLEMVEEAPMIHALFTQLGIDLKAVVKFDKKLLLDMSQKNYNVFYVESAKGSSHIPAQDDFVIPYGIRSVLGFGGVLPTGRLFAVVLFFQRHLPRRSAELFKALALSVKLGLLPFDQGPTFEACRG